MLEFASPMYFWLFAPLGLAVWWMLRGGACHGALAYSDVRLFGRLTGLGAVRWQWVPGALRVAALSLLIVALARPRFGTVERDVIGEGVDLMYCLDISNSMRAEDFVPNRLERAKVLTAQMVDRRRNDRQGITLFAGRAFVYCPLTFDNNAVKEMLRHVDFADLESRYTAIGMGLARALKKMEDSEAKSRVIILMTDGENNKGRIGPVDAVKIAKELGVKIYTIGIGSRNRMYRTQIDEELLERIAKDTGGIYRRARSGRELEEILEEIDGLEKSEIEMREYRTYSERMGYFLWPGLGLLLGELFLRRTRFMRIP